MKRLALSFVREDRGQDLVEYALLLAFVCLASTALFLGAGSSITGIWTLANSRLSESNSAVANGN